ncbi:MAG: radical SAM protein, partial [Candidatus Portnoybacteria bacterium]
MKKEMRKQSFDEIMVEPTNICNLKCPVCLTGGNYDKRKKGNMGFPQFKKILDPITGSLKSINLWGFGEPFLAPDILKMIDYLDQNNVSVNLHTNGTTLDKKTINHFKKNQKISLTFSIDGITDKTYLYYRRGGNLKKALGNL